MLKQVNFNGKLCSLDAPLTMAIINVTPDSFYDGGRYMSDKALITKAEQSLKEGADILDIGTASTRPHAADISENEEAKRLANAVRTVHTHFPSAVISVDTWRASAAHAALDEGASMINDISGGTFDPALIPLVGKYQVPYCLTHTPAKPEVMQQHTCYRDIIADMLQFFGLQLQKLHEAHVHDIFIDPGFGFGKTLEQNYFLMNNLNAFQVLEYPILVGISRKSMIYKLLDETPQGALDGTIALNTIALIKGASVLRVHDVKEARQVIAIVNMLCHAGDLLNDIAVR